MRSEDLLRHHGGGHNMKFRLAVERHKDIEVADGRVLAFRAEHPLPPP